MLFIIIIFFLKVDEANPPFPRPTAHWWFGCRNTPSAFDSLGNVQASETSNHDDVGDFYDQAGE